MKTEVQTARLDKDIEELEKLAFGTTEEVKDDEESAETTNSDVTKPTTEDTVAETGETVSPPPETEKPESTKDWELDYKNLRRDTDNYKYNTRQELANLKEQLVNVRRENEALKKNVITPKVDPFKDTFSKEEVETVGEDALSLMKKAATTAADARAKGLEDELAQERSKNLQSDQASVEQDRQTATKIFLKKLGEILPEYNDVNLDPGFEKYIKEADPINGGSRLMHFKNAEASGNVNVVAQYMRDFLSTKAPKDTLAERVTPTGAPVAETSGESKVVLIPISEIETFYEDSTKGKYKGNQTAQRELEAKYDLAFSTGAVDYMR